MIEGAIKSIISVSLQFNLQPFDMDSFRYVTSPENKVSQLRNECYY